MSCNFTTVAGLWILWYLVCYEIVEVEKMPFRICRADFDLLQLFVAELLQNYFCSVLIPSLVTFYYNSGNMNFMVFGFLWDRWIWKNDFLDLSGGLWLVATFCCRDVAEFFMLLLNLESCSICLVCMSPFCNAQFFYKLYIFEYFWNCRIWTVKQLLGRLSLLDLFCRRTIAELFFLAFSMECRVILQPLLDYEFCGIWFAMRSLKLKKCPFGSAGRTLTCCNFLLQRCCRIIFAAF
jgi:hypothetical protein